MSFVREPTKTASQILGSSDFSFCGVSELERRQWCDVLFDSLITEYDARRLYWHIDRHHPATFPDLIGLLGPWLRDEIDHAHGFALIYASCSGTPFHQAALAAELRRSDFGLIEDLSSDLFKLLVMLAYDEAVTTHVYHRAIPLYDKLGSPALSAWIRKLKRDEASHFLAFLGEAKRRFPERASEVPRILEEILFLDFSKERYSGTFVLDHNAPDFPLSQLEIEARIIPMLVRKFRA